MVVLSLLLVADMMYNNGWIVVGYGRGTIDDRDASFEIYEHIARQIQPASRQSLKEES